MSQLQPSMMKIATGEEAGSIISSVYHQQIILKWEHIFTSLISTTNVIKMNTLSNCLWNTLKWISNISSQVSTSDLIQQQIYKLLNPENLQTNTTASTTPPNNLVSSKAIMYSQTLQYCWNCAVEIPPDIHLTLS